MISIGFFHVAFDFYSPSLSGHPRSEVGSVLFWFNILRSPNCESRTLTVPWDGFGMANWAGILGF